MTENNDDVRFLYTVCPKKPIKNLNESISLIRISKSLYLTKEEVIKCLDCGSVYRRFSNEGINEKTNKYDVDRVHRENYISKADWALMQNNAADTNNLKVNGVAEAPKPEKKEEKVIVEKQPKVEDAITPEKKVEVVTSGYAATEEDVVSAEVESEIVTNVPEDAEPIIIDAKTAEIEDINKVTAETVNNDEITDDTVVEAVDIEAVEEESENITEDSTENTSNNNIVVNYNGKKKKHH